jgi:hypothetical protein
LPILSFSQDKTRRNLAANSKDLKLLIPGKILKATTKRILFVSIERDTTYLDTSLTIQKEYSLIISERHFWFVAFFLMKGKLIITLQYGLAEFFLNLDSRQNILIFEANDIKYSSVATPVTELYFKSVMQKGQTRCLFLL